MKHDNLYNDDDRQYLQMIQDNINRMSSNCANCKNWMVMIVAAMFAVSCGINDMNWWLLLTILPIWLFWYLDAFYLRLERGMRNRHRQFLNICAGIETEKLYSSVLYSFRPFFIDRPLDEEEINKGYVTTRGCSKAKSIMPFYLIALVIVLIIVIAINVRGLFF